jgi:hypothetical protein
MWQNNITPQLSSKQGPTTDIDRTPSTSAKIRPVPGHDRAESVETARLINDFLTMSKRLFARDNLVAREPRSSRTGIMAWTEYLQTILFIVAR